MKKVILSGLVTAFAAGTAIADETWNSEIGEVYYADEINGYAVFHFPTMREGVESIGYLKDLAGNYYQRDHTFEGYWVEPAAAASTVCDVAIVDERGDTYRSWGRIKLVFTETGYPSGWVALLGDCFDEPSHSLTAKPILGDATVKDSQSESDSEN